MLAIIWIALKDLKQRWILALVMALLFSITFATYLALITYQKSLSMTYFSLETNWLVTQVSFGSGEIHGSRLKPEIEQLMREYGYQPIPEIHQVVGTSISNGIMMRGVRPEDLLKVSPFKLMAGRNLIPTDPPRLTMVGIGLANRLKINVGDTLQLRGREFSVIGVFKTGSYEDSQAWISLSDAQKLLDYGSDVSIYYIPDGGSLHEGFNLAKGISIGRRGEAGNTFGKEIMSFFRYLGLIGSFAGVATSVTLTNLLWRLAWLHRREFGIARTLGFGRNSVVIYLLTQASLIVLLGAFVGGSFAVLLVISRIQDFSAFGIAITPIWDLSTIGSILMITFLIAGIGVAIPARRINTMTTPELLGRD
ncbi:MAG: FtsX-like permease family protein [Chloroflexi bacterium]|nr:FtsX-like permease family protein [Chloroflexota bacterium]